MRPVKNLSGFTLLEVMLVLVIMGLAVSAVSFSAFSSNPQDELEKHAKRFQVVFDMAVDFAVLNQHQLGLRYEKRENQYRFLILDDNDEWQLMDADPIFEPVTLPEPFEMELTLDDLPWEQEDSLFDEGVFDEQLSVSEEGVNIGNDEEKKQPPPQILLLSSGDITPFSLLFAYEPRFGNEDPVYFKINGVDSVPLQREGPLLRP